MILDKIQNYYEKLVLAEVLRQMAEDGNNYPESTLEDVVCVALNDLPPRYVRHTVDIAFYMTRTERETIDTMIKQAVKEAFVLVTSNPHPD